MFQYYMILYGCEMCCVAMVRVLPVHRRYRSKTKIAQDRDGLNRRLFRVGRSVDVLSIIFSQVTH